jgi:hypothetical protein
MDKEFLEQTYDIFCLVEDVFETGDCLFNLRRRPRCQDNSLNLRFCVNKSFSKNDVVTDFYDPKDPTINIRPELIKMYQLKAEPKTGRETAKNGA